jgi:hypothetical protein
VSRMSSIGGGIRLLCKMILLCSLTGLPTRAQTFTSVSGVVFDPTGAAVPGAQATLSNEGTGAQRATVTGADGTYGFAQVPAGQYTLTIEAKGFKKAIREHLGVLVATPARVDVTLQIGEMGQSVTVEAGAEALNTQDATIGAPFKEQEIKQLPFAARNPVNLLTLEPGVVFTGSSDTDILAMGSTQQLDPREGVVNGVRGNQSNISLDGVEANDYQNQSAFTSAVPVTLDSIQEFRVITTNATASSGAAGGAQVEMVTKSGSNEFHGNARWFNRDTFFAANSFFNKASGVDRPKLIRNIFGGSFGGPVFKDRVFFFLDYERRLDRSATPVARIVPSETLKQGVMYYELDTTANFDPNAPGVIPCPNGSGKPCRRFTPTQIASLDPGCSTAGSAGCGVDAAMLKVMGSYPAGNDPSLGFDAGLNSSGFRFNAPVDTTNNIYTSRIDFKLTRDGRHSMFWRGNLAGIKTDITAGQFPGLPPNNQLLNNSRSMVVSYTGSLTPRLVNTAAWGFVRQGIQQSGGVGSSLTSQNFSDPLNFSRGFGRRVPTHEIRDDLTWTRGTHTIQTGVDVQFPRNHFVTFQNSFPVFFLGDFGFCANDCHDPLNALQASGQRSVTPANITAFLTSFMELTGSLTIASASFFADPKTGQLAPPQGQPLNRHYAEDDIEWYLQDSWRLRPNFTLNFGLRYSYFGVPWEQNGLQTIPTINLDKWWNQRVAGMSQGIPADASPLVGFVLGGKANGRSSWYGPSTRNFAPRISVAYSPEFQSGIGEKFFGGPGNSSIRLGFGMYYDRVGGAIATDQAINGGDPGLISSQLTPIFLFGLATAPRFSGTCAATGGCTGFPSLSTFFPNAPSRVTFPFVPDTFIDNFNFAVNPKLRTPYSYDLDLSIERNIGKGVTAGVAYVGNLGRRLLLKKDYGQYLGNFKDPKSGHTLWADYNKLVDQIGPNPFSPATPIAQVKPVPWIEDLMPNMPAYAAALKNNPSLASMTPTQAFYAIVTGFGADWSDALLAMDSPPPGIGSPWATSVDPQRDGRVLFGPQFDSVPAWSAEGLSSYHSLQLSIRKKSGPILLDANYVFGKSIDNGSAAENADLFLMEGQVNGQIPNAFNVNAARAVSDFDLKHNFNADWVVDLPFGRGRRFGSQASGLLNGFIGNWQFTGTWRWHSGFPLSPRNGFNYATNDFQPGPATIVSALSSSVTKKDPNGFPNLFSNPAQALTHLAYTRPGFPGSRNMIRGPAYFNTDLGLGKSFTMPWSEKQRLQFRIEAFNAFNNVNFDSTAGQFSTTFPGAQNPIDAFDITAANNFGRLFRTAGPLGGAREVQVGIRYDF